MQVRAKMRCNSITKTGHDPKKPQVQVQLGAVYSNDPESENRSFANATPSASVNLSIDAGLPAAAAFEHGREYYVDFTPVGGEIRFYLGDYMNPVDNSEVIVESRDGSKKMAAVHDPKRTANRPWHAGDDCFTGQELIEKMGVTHWRHKRDGE